MAAAAAACCSSPLSTSVTLCSTSPSQRRQQQRRRKGGRGVCCGAAGLGGGGGGVRSQAGDSSDRIRIRTGVTTDIPVLREPVPITTYLRAPDRLFYALFPDRSRSARIGNDVWRVTMLEQEFFFFKVRPEVDMRIWVEEEQQQQGESSTSPVVRLQSLNCTLKGFEQAMRDADFDLDVHGQVAAETDSRSVTHLLGSMTLDVSFMTPAALWLTPRPLVEAAGRAVTSRILESLRENANRRLLEDYRSYGREVSLARK
eukprot:jgi/Chlat1/6997/Chrsp56S06658